MKSGSKERPISQNKKRAMSLRTQHLVTLVLAGAVPLTILLSFTGKFLEARLKDQAYKGMEETTALARVHLENRIARHMREARALANHPLLYGVNGTSAAEGLAHVRHAFEIFQRDETLLTLYTLNGLPLEFTTTEHLRSRSTTTAFKKALAGEPCATDAHILANSMQLVIALYYPVRNREGVIQNIVRQYIPIKNLTSNIHLQNDMAWISKSGEWLTGGNNNKLLRPFSESYAGWKPDAHRGICTNADGETYLYVQANLNHLEILAGSQLIHLVPANIALASYYELRSLVLATGAASFVLLALLSLIASHRIARPLRKAAAAASSVADGNLNTVLKVEGSSELRQLSTALNTMTSEVRQRRARLESEIAERTENLREVSAYMHAIIDGLNDALIVSDPNGNKIRFFNRAAEQLFNFNAKAPPEEQVNWDNLIASWVREPGEWDQFKSEISATNTRKEQLFSLSNHAIQNLEIVAAPVNDSDGNPMGELWMFRDASERERLEAEQRQNQKLEAVGRLAGGIAHDFNNILTTIQGGLELTQSDLENGDDPSEWIASSLVGCKRAAGVTQQLLSFSRQRPLDLGPVNINDSAIETINLLNNTIDHRIKIKTHYATDLARVKADDGQLQQVLMNLLINATHAIPHGGTIFIHSFKKELRKEEATKPYAYPGVFTCITIKDTGHGMNEETQEKIFDPFFTTKPQGKGTGLGLATSLGIMQRHQGWIECESKPEQGSTFTLYFPALEEDPIAETEQQKSISIRSALASRILIVDDESVIRRNASAMLTRAEHEVEEAENGFVALTKIEKAQEPFDLVILDLNMPELSGAETFRLIKLEWPELPVLIWSGYSQDAVSLFEAESRKQPDGFLSKPFGSEELNKKVADLIRKTRLNKKDFDNKSKNA